MYNSTRSRFDQLQNVMTSSCSLRLHHDCADMYSCATTPTHGTTVCRVTIKRKQKKKDVRNQENLTGFYNTIKTYCFTEYLHDKGIIAL